MNNRKIVTACVGGLVWSLTGITMQEHNAPAIWHGVMTAAAFLMTAAAVDRLGDMES